MPARCCASRRRQNWLHVTPGQPSGAGRRLAGHCRNVSVRSRSCCAAASVTAPAMRRVGWAGAGLEGGALARRVESLARRCLDPARELDFDASLLALPPLAHQKPEPCLPTRAPSEFPTRNHRLGVRRTPRRQMAPSRSTQLFAPCAAELVALQGRGVWVAGWAPAPRCR